MSVLENHELVLQIGVHALLQDGFFHPDRLTADLHRHRYAELNLITAGRARFLIGDRIFHAEYGQAWVVPAGVFHQCLDQSADCCRPAFLIDCNAPAAERALPGLAAGFAAAIQSGRAEKIAAYLSVLCCELLPEKRSAPLPPIQDREFLICEFFSHACLPDLKLEDLAALLHLSKKQTARAVERCCGRTFRAELIRCRLEAAAEMRRRGLPLEEIAAQVGYHSVSGLWKALKAADQTKA